MDKKEHATNGRPNNNNNNKKKRWRAERNNDNKKRNTIIDSWEAENRFCSHTNSDSNNVIDVVMAGFQLKTKKPKKN